MFVQGQPFVNHAIIYILDTPFTQEKIPKGVLCPFYLQGTEKGGTEVVKTDILRSLLTNPSKLYKTSWELLRQQSPGNRAHNELAVGS